MSTTCIADAVFKCTVALWLFLNARCWCRKDASWTVLRVSRGPDWFFGHPAERALTKVNVLGWRA